MTRRRWIADEFSDTHAALTGAHAEHLARVLRARVGQQFDIATGASVRRGLITSISSERVDFALAEEVPTTSPAPVVLLLSVFKFDRMEWAIEKCTELGAARVIPVIAHRSDAHLASAAGKRVERWDRIARQASEQSRRSVPLQIASPLRLKEAVLLAGSPRVVLSELEQDRGLNEVLEDHPPDGELLIAIGPEGGWTEQELALFAGENWISASLGKTILRAETAAVAATAIAISLLS